MPGVYVWNVRGGNLFRANTENQWPLEEGIGTATAGVRRRDERAKSPFEDVTQSPLYVHTPADRSLGHTAQTAIVASLTQDQNGFCARLTPPTGGWRIRTEYFVRNNLYAYNFRCNKKNLKKKYNITDTNKMYNNNDNNIIIMINW